MECKIGYIYYIALTVAKDSAKDLWQIYSDRFFTVYSPLCTLKTNSCKFYIHSCVELLVNCAEYIEK